MIIKTKNFSMPGDKSKSFEGKLFVANLSSAEAT